MRVLVTGGAGFIGSNLVCELEAHGHEVAVLDDLSTGFRSNLAGTNAQLCVGSILDRSAVDELAAPADAIVHLAARSSVPRSLDDPHASHEVNATGTLNVLEAARTNGGCHVIVASSSSVYGANAVLPKQESAATRPMSPYAASKLAAESYALGHGTSFGLPTLAFRFFNVFGPRQMPGHAYAAVIPAFVHAALTGAPLIVHGDGTQSRDFTPVGTVVSTLRKAVERQVVSGDPVNLAFGSRISLNDVIDRLAIRIDEPLLIDHVERRRGDVPHSQADDALLRALIADLDPTPFDTALDETIDWMRGHIANASADIVLEAT